MNLPLQAFNDDHEQYAVVGARTSFVAIQNQMMDAWHEARHEEQRQAESLAEWTNESEEA